MFGDIVSIETDFSLKTFKSLQLFDLELNFIIPIYLKNFPALDTKWTAK